ncbi:proline-specific peptidase [Wolfiporia cocos MD-104 SS10]|uniref:Proline-specific peptidase n=1 Tax=Wolfiporia cocos (strain MD-104) TaxID=742152 RepID=A0A2H3JLN4_WOLCO|nr:proline-specific peptidase [Wolfiporia cocos MD-104 SS10]
MEETTGTIPFTYGGETYQTWYKVVGDLKGGVRPLVVLHGGPGTPHHYMIPHGDLATLYNIPIIFYDQLGSGGSTHLPGKPPGFWTVDLFMDELANLLTHLGIEHDFDLLGNSWGAMLAGNFAAARRPEGLKHLVIANGGASMELWQIGTRALLGRLPPDVRDTIERHEKERTYESKEYKDAMHVFNMKHICKVDPWPQELLQSFAVMGDDPTVYRTMVGPSEFYVHGTLKTWSIVDQLQNIAASTLLINSHDDTAQDIALMPFFLKIPHVKWVQFAHSSHTPFFEERERYMTIVGNFLMTL